LTKEHKKKLATTPYFAVVYGGFDTEGALARRLKVGEEREIQQGLPEEATAAALLECLDVAPTIFDKQYKYLFIHPEGSYLNGSDINKTTTI